MPVRRSLSLSLSLFREYLECRRDDVNYRAPTVVVVVIPLLWCAAVRSRSRLFLFPRRPPPYRLPACLPVFYVGASSCYSCWLMISEQGYFDRGCFRQRSMLVPGSLNGKKRVGMIISSRCKTNVRFLGSIRTQWSTSITR